MPTIKSGREHLAFSLDDFFRCGNCKKFNGCVTEGARSEDYICSEFEPANAIMQKFSGEENTCWLFISRISKNKIWLALSLRDKDAVIHEDIKDMDFLLKEKNRKSIARKIAELIEEEGNEEIQRITDALRVLAHNVTKLPLKKPSCVYYLPHFEKDGRLYLQIRLGEDDFAFAFIEDGKVKVVEEIKTGGGIIRPLPLPKNERGVVMNIVKMPDANIKNAKLLEPEELYKKILHHINKYADLSYLDRQLVTFYVLFTWFYLKVNTVGYLRLLGDTGKGKSRILKVVGDLCFYPLTTGGLSSVSGAIRTQERWHGTMLIDESDLKGDKECKIIKYLNQGFERDKYFILSDKKNPRRQEIFDPFSPKVIAMREPFRDNATEGRVFSVTPHETIREDIPILLDDKYEEEAQQLRNEIARFVLHHWDKVKKDCLIDFKDLNLEPRLRQLSMPLSIIFQIWSEGIEIFREYLLKRQREIKKIRANSWEGTVFNTVYRLATGEDSVESDFPQYYSGDSKPVAITPSMIAKALHTTPHNVTKALLSIGFEVERDNVIIDGKRRTIRKYVVPDGRTWVEICRRYYYDEEADTQEIPSTPDVLKSKTFTPIVCNRSVTTVTTVTPSTKSVTNVTNVTQYITHSNDINKENFDDTLLSLIPKEPAYVTIDEIMKELGFSEDDPDYEERQDYVTEKLKELAIEGMVKILDENFSKFSRSSEKEVMPHVP